MIEIIMWAGRTRAGERCSHLHALFLGLHNIYYAQHEWISTGDTSTLVEEGRGMGHIHFLMYGGYHLTFTPVPFYKVHSVNPYTGRFIQ